MGLRARAEYYALLAACLLLPLQNAIAQDALPGVPAQETAAGSPLTGRSSAGRLPPLGTTADNVTKLAVDAGVGETDNILRTAHSPESQTLALVGVDLDVTRAGRRLNADLKGDFNYIDYLQNAFKSQLLGRFDATASWDLLPERVRWTVEDHFGQAQVDPFASVTPANLENINVVSTGPDWVLHPGGQGVFVKLGARYAYTQYETNPFDNRRLVGDVSVGRELSPRSSVSLNADLQQLRFVNTQINTDYDRRRFYGHYAIRGARTELAVDAGASQADDLGSWKTTPFARIELTRVMSAASVLQVNLGRQYSDASDSFRSLQSGAAGRIVVAPTQGTTESYLDQYGSAAWRFQHHRTEMAVTGSWERQTYAGNPLLNVERLSAEVRLSRRMTGRLTAELAGSAGRERFLNAHFTDEFYLGSAVLDYKLARRLDLKVRYDHEARITPGASSGFVENRVLATVGYQVLPWSGRQLPR